MGQQKFNGQLPKNRRSLQNAVSQSLISLKKEDLVTLTNKKPDRVQEEEHNWKVLERQLHDPSHLYKV